VLRPVANQSDATQQWASAAIGAIAGGGTGASTARDGEEYNRQLHQREIAWIKAHAGDFGAITGLSPENAKRLLTLAGMTLVDAKMALLNAANVQALIDKGFTKEQVAYAQQYLTSNTNGETFHNEFADRDEELFTTHNAVEYGSSYDPNKPAAGQILQTVATDALGSAAMAAIVKAGGAIVKIGGKYYTKLKNGNVVEVPHIGSIHPDPTLNKNIEETMSYIMNGEKPPSKIKYHWGVEYKNKTNDLPTVDKSGNPITYREYRVRTPQGEENVHRIVVGSDGKYYYSNTHYGQPDNPNMIKGIPFYEAGKLPKNTIKKIFQGD
jgi:guanyl-specific ribonuclease Sa